VDSFVNLLKVLGADEPVFSRSIGQPVRNDRAHQVVRNLNRLVKRGIAPRAALRLLVDEIVNTSLVEKHSAVGPKVLGFCVPKNSAQHQLETGRSAMLAKQPDNETTTFTYFEPGFSELKQYGPTFACGKHAYADIATESDPSREFQSVQFKILSMPGLKQYSVRGPRAV
jgi:hypothetical protein